jgi:hypothetical protein
MKIPKSVRKGPIASFLNSGAGQLVLAQALVGAAGVFAASKTDPDSRAGDAVRHPVQHAKQTGRTLKRESAEQAARLSYALKEASRAFRTAMEQGPPPGDPEWTKETLEPELAQEEPAKKKSSSRTGTAPPH